MGQLTIELGGFSYSNKKVECFSAAVVSNDISRTFIPIGECLYLDVAFPKIDDNSFIPELFPGLPMFVNRLEGVDTCIDIDAVLHISITGVFSPRKRNYTLHLKAQKCRKYSSQNSPCPSNKFELEISDFSPSL